MTLIWLWRLAYPYAKSKISPKSDYQIQRNGQEKLCGRHQKRHLFGPFYRHILPILLISVYHMFWVWGFTEEINLYTKVDNKDQALVNRNHNYLSFICMNVVTDKSMPRTLILAIFTKYHARDIFKALSNALVESIKGIFLYNTWAWWLSYSTIYNVYALTHFYCFYRETMKGDPLFINSQKLALGGHIPSSHNG